MGSHLPYDVNSTGRQSWSFPASCSLGSVSLPDDGEGYPCGRNFPSSGTIPILLFDDDSDGLLDSDPTGSLSPQFDNTRPGASGSKATGQRVIQGSSSGVLGIVESPAVRGSPEEQSPTRGGYGRNDFNGSQRPGQLRFNPVDSEPFAGSDDHRGDDEGRDLFLFMDADSPPSHCHCCPPTSRSSSLSRLSEASSVLHTPRGQNMRRTRSGSCGASPAAISNIHLIGDAKRRQDIALETVDLRFGQPSSNSISLYDGVQQVRLPLTLNHDHHIRNQQRDPRAASSPTSFTEADLAIDFPPRDPVMGRDLPPSYSQTIEPPSSPNLDLPHHLAWLQNITISLCIDQEGFRAVCPTFKLVGYTKPTLPIHSSRAGMQKLLAGGNNTSIKQLSELMDQTLLDTDLAANLDVGVAVFMPLKRESFVFHHSTLDTPPSIRRLSVNGDESRDYLSKHAYLSIKSTDGFQVYAVQGSEVRRGSGGEDATGRAEGGFGSSPIKLEWRFEYTVEDKRKAGGTKASGGEKFLTPLRFSCSPGLLHPKQGRKVTVLSVWRKSIQPSLVAGKVEPPAITFPTTSGHQTHNLAGSISPPTSPKGIGVGPLRFPTATRLWGKRTKSSPYRFDKGSDGSEEDLIPSEDSPDRRRRPRPNSSFVSRVSQDTERLLHGWDEDRSQGTDFTRSGGLNARPATAGGERLRGRSKIRSPGRGAASEGEYERAQSRSSQGRQLTSRSVYTRRPRTAR